MDMTTLMLRHMGWANQEVYRAVATLPDEALAAYIENPEWTAGRILQHIVRTAGRLRFSLLPELPWREYEIPTTMAEVRALADDLRTIDADLLRAVATEDGPVEPTLPDGTVRTFQRLTILAQTVHHATEHRAQLLDALNARGYFPIVLDNAAVSSFEAVDRA